jgi:hypothetical protein
MGEHNNNPTVIMGDNHTHNINIVVNITFENPNMEQLKNGIVPHEQEVKDLLKYHAKDMYNIFQIFITRHPDVKYSNNDLMGIVINLVQLFYSNEKTPHHMNILNDDPGSNHHKVFSGKEFIDDLLPKNIRNKRVIQILLYQLKEYINNFNEPYVITKFINETLIPFIVKSYFGEICSQSIEKALSQNSEHLKKLNLKQIPNFPFEDLHLSPNSFKTQFLDFREGDKSLQEDFKIATEKDLNNIEIGLIKKQTFLLK